jgi:hypothetical protein
LIVVKHPVWADQSLKDNPERRTVKNKLEALAYHRWLAAAESMSKPMLIACCEGMTPGLIIVKF